MNDPAPTPDPSAPRPQPLWLQNIALAQQSHWLDVALIAGLALFALYSFYVTPEFAANLPWDAADYAVPSVNLLEHGRLDVQFAGKSVPPVHPIGMPLLLAPAYILFGHFIGNGIYAILACALGTMALLYGVGRKLGGRWCGVLAALFLISHHGFWQYSQKIMSEVPINFLVTAVFAVLVCWPSRWSAVGRDLAAGFLLGLAVAVRHDSVIMAVPVLFLMVGEPLARSVRRAVCVGAGALPWLVALAIFQQASYGSWWRTGGQYADAHWIKPAAGEQATFSTRNLTTSGLVRAGRLDPQLAGMVEGHLPFYGKSLLSEVDTSRIFHHPLYWRGSDRPVYKSLIGARAFVGLAGFSFCLCWWRSNSTARLLGLWFLGALAIHALFFALFFAQEERYLMKLVPALCLLDAVGVCGLWTALQPAPDFLRRTGRIVLASGMVALLGSLAFYNWKQGFPRGDELYVYEALREVAGQIEPDAVVVTNFNLLKVETLVVRGTRRACYPLNAERNPLVQPQPGGPVVPLYPLIAAEQPAQLAKLLQGGRPCYLVLENPWSARPCPELKVLGEYFRIDSLATVSVRGQTALPYLARLRVK